MSFFNAKEEFRNFFILLKKDKWFTTNCDYSQLEKIDVKTVATQQSTWKYDVKKVIFKNIDLKRHIKPSFDAETADATLELEVYYQGEFSVLSNKIYDQTDSIGMKITVKCDYWKNGNIVESECQWHFDKHDTSKNCSTIHPLFHFEYGGTGKKEKEGFDFGNFIILDTPRIIHPPLDVVLAIDFVIKNFYRREDIISLTEGSPLYKRYIQNAHHRLWRPYVLALASNFHKLDNLEFDLEFTKNIIECPYEPNSK
jgi:hypothetical protein